MTERHPFLGKIVTGRIHSGSVAVGDKLKVLWKDGEWRLEASMWCSLPLATKRVCLPTVCPPNTCVCLLSAFGRQPAAGGEDLGFKVTKLMKRSGTGTGARVV